MGTLIPTPTRHHPTPGQPHPAPHVPTHPPPDPHTPAPAHRVCTTRTRTTRGRTTPGTDRRFPAPTTDHRGHPGTGGGPMGVVHPWAVAGEDLAPVSYRYRVR
ncbi:hypothetical protein GCM10027184_02580 [Saccharothrix stipae]